MILNKKGLAVLPIAALLFATGCAKKISYEEAKQFVIDNYKDSAPTKKPTKFQVKFSVDAKNEATKTAIKGLADQLKIELKESGDNLKYEGDIPVETFGDGIPVITADSLPAPEEGLEISYSVKGKSLSLDLHAAIKSETTFYDFITVKSANAHGSAGVNDQGYPTYADVKLDLDAIITMPVPPVPTTFSEGTEINFTNGEISLNATY